MSEIKELDAVALTCDLPDYRLRRGDVGAVVLVHDKGAAIEVEFVGYDGHTVALLTLNAAKCVLFKRMTFRTRGSWRRDLSSMCGQQLSF